MTIMNVTLRSAVNQTVTNYSEHVLRHLSHCHIGSYDCLIVRLVDRQCLLRYPEAVAYCDRSFLLVVGHRTIGRRRGRAINTDWRRSMTRSIISKEIVRLVVAIIDRSYDQSWPPTIDRTINRGILHDQSIGRATGRKVARPSFTTNRATAYDLE